MEQAARYYRLTVYGLVQGVGFRPFILELCRKRGIRGNVKNTGSSAVIYLYTDEETAGALKRRLSCIRGNDEGIPGARIDEVHLFEISVEEFEKNADPKRDFYIEKSSGGSERIRFIPPDIGICETCRREMTDPRNRRYRHPFISCVSCGPRFSIMKGVPYDRENTTMMGFELCDECRQEYISPGKRRHAQIVACNKCGPKPAAYIADSEGKAAAAAIGEEAIKLVVAYIKEGKTAAVKNTGGYHFVFDATREKASEKLRSYKQRENKPFAVMFSDTGDIGDYCQMSEKEKELLISPERPIVLLKKNGKKKLAAGICDDSLCIGAMLPSDGIQVLLMEEKTPLVMTSANRRGQPQVCRDEDALLFIEEGACDIVLANDREVVNPLDDSIYQVVSLGDREIIQTLRRARGLVPAPLFIAKKVRGDSFAAGGDMKAVFAFARDDRVFPGGHFGDLSDENSQKSRYDAARSLQDMLGIKPECFVSDAHPGYHSSEEVKEKSPLRILHHHAHLLSVAAEHGLEGKLAGAAFDGTGYGGDGTVWGGEFLIFDTRDTGSLKRAGCLMPVRMAGGDSIAYDAGKAAMCFVYEAISRGLLREDENPFEGERYGIVESAVKNDVNVHLSTSAGRFFDACAALLGVCMTNTYEGECPAKLEAKAEMTGTGSGGGTTGLKASIIKEGDMYVADTVALFADLIRLKKRGEDTGTLAFDIHFAIADIIIRILTMTGEENDIKRFLLGGGTFANRLLVRMIIPALSEKGFEVYINEKVPPGDGGLALGQIYAVCGED